MQKIIFLFILVCAFQCANSQSSQSEANPSSEFQGALNDFNSALDSYTADPDDNGRDLVNSVQSIDAGSKLSTDLNGFVSQLKQALDSHGVDINAPVQMNLPYLDNSHNYLDPTADDGDIEGDDSSKYGLTHDIFSYSNTYIGCVLPGVLEGDSEIDSNITLRKFLNVIRLLHINLEVQCGGKTPLEQISERTTADSSNTVDVDYEKNKELLLSFVQEYPRQNANSDISQATNTRGSIWSVGNHCVEETKKQSKMLTMKFGKPMEIESKACGVCPDNTLAHNLSEVQSWAAVHYKPRANFAVQLYIKFIYLRPDGTCYRHVFVYPSNLPTMAAARTTAQHSSRQTN